MKKEILLLAAAAVIATASAAPITPEQAIERAKTESPARARAIRTSEVKLVHTAKTASGEAAAYIFTRPDESGFSILSANDLATPVLGYSNSENFDPQNMPPALKWWLDQYAAQIEYAEANGLTGSTKMYAPETWSAIEPLVKTKWDQGAPYSNQCPTLNGTVCPTGCVATSMAQAMNYFKYPEQAEGSVSYKWTTSRSLFLNYASQAFDWDNMLDYYVSGEYSDTEASAVSYLMKACGYSVEMGYATDASGAMSNKITTALTTYFKYDKGIQYLSRDSYSYNDWAKMCYDNIKNVGPIIYNGTDPIAGGHSFICDGYDGAGYFHINWGWSGMSDGYFSLDALTPVAQGSGGAEGGFNYSQDAVFGMQKPTGEEVESQPLALTQYGATTATVSGKKVTFSATDHYLPGWLNLNNDTMEFHFGAIVEPEDGSEEQFVLGTYGNSNYQLSLSSYQMYRASYGSPAVTLPTLSDGTYKVRLATRDVDTKEYTPVSVPYGYPNYAILTVENGVYSVENVAAELLQFETCELTSPLYRNRNTRLKAHIVNPYDKQLTACVTPHLDLDGVTQYQAETILVTVDANSEVDYEWVAKFYEMSGASDYVDPTSYELTLYNQETHLLYGSFGNVEMTTTSNSYTVKSDNLSIEGAEKQTVTIGEKDYNNVYVVNDASNFTIDFGYHVSKGYFDSTMTLCIYRKGTDGTTYIPVTDILWESTPFLSANESESVSVPVEFGEAETDMIYYVRAEYIRNGVQTYLNQISFTMPNASGVDSVFGDSVSSEAEYYNLQGVRVASPAKGEILIKRQGSSVSKVIY